MNAFLMSPQCSGSFTYDDCIKDIKKLTEETEEHNYHYCIVYLLVLKEQIVEITPEKKEEFESAFQNLKKHAKKISDKEWHSLIENASYITHKEEKIEENRSSSLINLVIETLIRTSSADIERAIEVYLEEEMKDPRTQTQKSVSSEIIEEILENISKLPEKEKRQKIRTVSKLLKKEHTPILIKYVHSLSKVLLLSLYLTNKKVYNSLHDEFFKKAETPEEYALLEHFPQLDLPQILRLLHKNSSIFKLLDRIIKTRPVHRDKIVDFVIEYISSGGSRTKSINFIKDNLSCFIDKVQSIGLGCEEVLLLSQSDPSLLNYAFTIMHSLKVELKEKRVANAQKKERRLSLLISALATELSSLSAPATTDSSSDSSPSTDRSLDTVSAFVKEAHKTDPDLLSKVCIALFRMHPPAAELVSTLSVLVQSNTTRSFVFTALPYLDNSQKFTLLQEYLTDDVSLTLFLRMLQPVDIFVHAHTLPPGDASRVLGLCWGRPDVFTDRVVSSALGEVCRGDHLPPVFSRTVRDALQAHANMRPFIAGLMKREAPRLLAESAGEVVKILEALKEGAIEVCLCMTEEELPLVLRKSRDIAKRFREYLRTQPRHIREKYREITQKI
ncbi:hypothetical protein NEMIN01_0387 [Nematocida minor]|uniref:uncharacterized protein n=1 Tax=Nematocida minor TaxID=1912983 RepID=UPI0022209A9A|nr:uncharacterized protein NEMIN01_0387 [Nematocida minor]KAI5189221.1 hypothetical protein NEMIN01_0387 [Nematocida minor]